LPEAKRFGLLIDTNTTAAEQLIASPIGRQIEVASAHDIREIDAAFATFLKKKVDAVIISPTALFSARRAQILTLAAWQALPTVFYDREAVAAGGLMSYGPSLAEQVRQIGIYTGRILHGEKPSTLPVLQPTKFSLVINLSTARALGLTIPETLLATADEVIQ
jgi:putative ABC transport system substrate-binding protein